MSSVNVIAEIPNKDRSLKKVSFKKVTNNGFQKDVKERVDQFFQTRNISKFANSEMVIKTILILSGWMATYFLILSNLISPWGMLVLAIMHGFFAALIGMNIAHDALHGSFSKNATINKIFGLLFNLVGANDYVWGISHNIVHHTYTNIPHHDEDIHQLPILRMEPTQELWKIHRYQHVYAFFLYCLTTLSWVFKKDYVKFFQHQLGGHYRKTFPKKEIFRLFFYKALYYTLYLVIPLLVINLPWYWIIFGFVMAHFVEGFTLAIIFMLAHIIEDTEYPEPGADGKIDMPWADLQMHTTANFAAKNRAVNYLFGGLNFQIVHHLFPKISHVHYPKIAEIIKQTAKDHQLPFIEHKTFFGAIASHTRVLKKFGAAQI